MFIQLAPSLTAYKLSEFACINAFIEIITGISGNNAFSVVYCPQTKIFRIFLVFLKILFLSVITVCS